MKNMTRIALVALIALFGTQLGCQGSVSDGETLPDDPDDPGDTPDDPGDVPDEPVEPVDARISEGLVGLYDFSTGSGNIVYDRSGSGYNLEILDPDNVVWLEGGGIDIVNDTALVNPNPATHISGPCKASNSITVETWARTNSVAQEGPARVVSLSLNPNERNFTLGQATNTVNFRLRTTETDQNGTPATLSDSPEWDGQIKHYVYTRANDALEGTVYVDGVIAGTDPVLGNLSTWSDEYPLTLANEPTLNRPWRGQLYLVAIYCDAKNAIDISQNMTAGY